MKTSQARRVWEQTAVRGEMSWLEDSTFISANCFAVPPLKFQPRAWDRIPVPTAVAFGTDRKIYKRVSAKQCLDKTYNNVVAELESQAFEERKRARKNTYARPYPGHVDFDPEDEEMNTGTQDLALAREEVSIAYRNIWKDNRSLPALSHKRSTYEPAKLMWIPRKRHNTRWPINPPNKDATMIADLQPLIKFELYSHQVDETALRNQDQQHIPEPSQEIHEVPQQTKKTNKPRRHTLRPSLGTIPEKSNEAPSIRFLTPNAKTDPAYMSPVKRWSAPADRFKTPTKVAGSPVSKFTLSATPEAGQFEITNEQGYFQVPSPTNTETTTCISDAGFDTRTHHQVPSPTTTESTTRRTTATEPTTYDTASENTYHTEVPIFDQPSDQVQAEPEHESKRRISLDNARRSDRGSDTKVLKRVKNWITSTHTVNRRHSDVAHILEQSQGTNRRHTLDVDMGRNPDIFAQKLPETEVHVPQEQSRRISDQGAQQPGKSMFEIKFKEFQQKLAKRKRSPMNEIDMSAEIDEEVLQMYLDPESTTKSESMESTQPSEQSPRKYTPGMEIPWDDVKLFAGVKIASTTKNASEVISTQDTNIVDVSVSESIGPDTVGIVINSEESTNSPRSSEGEGGDEDLSEATDLSNISEESDSVRIDEPTVDVFDGTVQQVDDANELSEEMAAETDEVMASEEDKDTADDDSALALLHSFVRRAQHSKEGKQSTIQDSVPILSSMMAKKHFSSSMGSATSDTGSPMARIEPGTNTPSPRKPLGSRDANRSPSPKKRKLGETEDAPLVKQSGRLAKPDLEDIEPSQPKKRRKRMESDTDDIFNPDMDLSQVLTQKSRGIARRSSRIATTKSSKADNAQSGFSTIPVRLPGSSGMLQDTDMPAVSTTGITNAVLQRKVEKDLATETRTNTRRNKGGAVPVPIALVVLAQQQQQAGESTIEMSATKARPTGRKTVRWNPTLARVQGEEEPSTVVATVTSPEVQEVDSRDGEHDEDDENLPSPPRMRHVGLSPDRPSNPVAGQLDEQAAVQSTASAEPQPRAEPEKKQLPRRSTRSSTASRLPRGASPATTATPKKSSLPAPSRVPKSGRPAASSGVASSIAGRLGTPAPKRRGARR